MDDEDEFFRLIEKQNALLKEIREGLDGIKEAIHSLSDG